MIDMDQICQNKLVLESDVSPHKQIVKDYDAKECISIEESEN